MCLACSRNSQEATVAGGECVGEGSKRSRHWGKGKGGGRSPRVWETMGRTSPLGSYWRTLSQGMTWSNLCLKNDYLGRCIENRLWGGEGSTRETAVVVIQAEVMSWVRMVALEVLRSVQFWINIEGRANRIPDGLGCEVREGKKKDFSFP